MTAHDAEHPNPPPTERDLEAMAELAELPEMNRGPVCRFDTDGVITLANTAARRLFGDTDIRGRRVEEVCPDVDRHVWVRILASSTPVACEAELGARCVMFTFVCSRAGRSVFAYGVDITERRDAERRLKLNQVWTNLIDNAADATGGRGTIAIRTRRGESEVTVEIEDDGRGIPEADQARIFDPFFTTKPPGQGVGLGLSTSYAIVVEKHGGSIAVDSRPGSTRFAIRLPFGVRS